MTAWFVIVVPLVIMFFALFMERVEARLRRLAVREDEVEEFLDQAQPDEVKELFGSGIGGALEKFHGRRLPGGRTPQARRDPGQPVGTGSGTAG